MQRNKQYANTRHLKLPINELIWKVLSLKEINDKLTAEKLGESIKITAVQIKSVVPNNEILQSATKYVAAQNELRVKETEVEIAKKESERMQALSQNSKQSIDYMNAQAALNISEGVKNGKVNTIIIPSNVTAIGSFK